MTLYATISYLSTTFLQKATSFYFLLADRGAIIFLKGADNMAENKNIVKELRIRAGMQQKELAILAGVSRPTVSEWEHGKKNPSGERLKRLSEIFNVDIGTILGYSPGFIPIRPAAVPIIGSIACGERVTPDTNPDGFLDLPDGVHADFALRCKGDSMQPTFMDGDFVLIRAQPEVEPGQIAAVNIGDETTLKHVYIQSDGVLLTADNAKYPPVFVSAGQADEILIHGLAVGYTRLFS